MKVFPEKEDWKVDNYKVWIFPQKFGVYALVYKNRVLYIGCTKNLRNRLYRHPKAIEIFIDFKLRSSLKVYYKVTKTMDRGLESRLIGQIKPKYNYIAGSAGEARLIKNVSFLKETYEWVEKTSRNPKENRNFSNMVDILITEARIAREIKATIQNIKK